MNGHHPTHWRPEWNKIEKAGQILSFLDLRSPSFPVGNWSSWFSCLWLQTGNYTTDSPGSPTYSLFLDSSNNLKELGYDSFLGSPGKC